MTHLIDSDWAIDVFNGQQTAITTLISLAPHGLFLSVVTYGELYEGAYYSRDPPTALGQLQTFLTGKTLLPVTPAIMERFGVMRGPLTRNLRQQIGDMDIVIAATAIHHNLTLLSRNVRDFQPFVDQHYLKLSTGI
jgi:predicted nucleic acid-binding protein